MNVIVVAPALPRHRHLDRLRVADGSLGSATEFFLRVRRVVMHKDNGLSTRYCPQGSKHVARPCVRQHCQFRCVSREEMSIFTVRNEISFYVLCCVSYVSLLVLISPMIATSGVLWLLKAINNRKPISSPVSSWSRSRRLFVD